MLNSPVVKIKEALTIEDVISTYIKIDRSGANFKAKCPFHNEKTPSFFISPDRGSYYCFGCGASGDIFTFVQEFEGLDFKGALKLLADKAGVEIQAYTPEMKEAESEKERLYRVMEEATKFFENNLAINAEVLEYLKNRGLTEKTIKDFRLGYAILDWRKLVDYLRGKNFTDKEIERAGLAKHPEDVSKAMYDRFRGRVMFPIGDSSGRIIAFSGRIFVDDGKSAKYLNSPETPIFSKNAVLYGLDKAKESIRNNNFSILVEGQMDLVLSHQAGYKNTIATSGTALSDSTVSKENVVSNLGLIRRLSTNIVLAFDGDKAGFNASNRASRIALALGMDVKVANLPEGVDPADLISKTGVDAWKLAIKESKHIIEFLLDKTLKESANDMRKAGRLIKENILPFVNSLESSIEKMHFIKKISSLSGIPETAIQDDLKKIEQELKFEKVNVGDVNISTNPLDRKDYILRKLSGIILWQRTLNEPAVNVDDIVKEITETLKVTEEEFFDKTKDIQGDLIFEAEVFYGGGADIQKDIGELVLNFKLEYLQEELSHKMRELSQAEMKQDQSSSVIIMKEISEINNKIQNIKNGRL